MATVEATPVDKVEEIIDRYLGRDQDLMAVLQDIQKEFNYLPEDALKTVNKKMRIPLGQIYSVATFYNAFSIEPKGKHQVCVCTGTACHVKGAPKLVEAFERELGIDIGHTTDDMEFSLEEVRCVGCCGLAPVVTVDDDLQGHLKVSRVPSVIKKYRKKSD